MFAKRMSFSWSLILQKGTRGCWGQLLSWCLAPVKALYSNTCANPFFPPGYFCLHRNGMFTHGLSDIITPFFLLSHYSKLEDVKHERKKPAFPRQVNSVPSKQCQYLMLLCFKRQLSLCNIVWHRIHYVDKAGLKFIATLLSLSLEHSDYRSEPSWPVSS